MQWVKDPAFSLQWLWLLLWCGFDPWTGNFCMPQVQPGTKQNKIPIRHLFFHISGGWKSKIKVLGDSLTAEDSLPVLWAATFLLCPHMAFLLGLCGGRELWCLFLFLQGHQPYRIEVMTSLNLLIGLACSHSDFRVRAATYTFGGETVQSNNRHLSCFKFGGCYKQVCNEFTSSPIH